MLVKQNSIHSKYSGVWALLRTGSFISIGKFDVSNYPMTMKLANGLYLVFNILLFKSNYKSTLLNS